MGPEISSSVSLSESPADPAEEKNTKATHKETGTSLVEEVEQEKWKPTKQVRLILTVQFIVAFVMAMDMTILTSTLPNLAKALNVNATKAFWIVSAYLLTAAVFQPLVASLADIFGRRVMYFAVVSLFTIGSIICASCNNIAGMLAGRTILGIGGGGIPSLNLIILSDLIPLRQRAQYQGYLQLVFALGSNTAPLIGGAIIQNTTWRWLFIINMPFCFVGLAAVPFVLQYERSASTFQSRIISMDWIGIGLFITGITTFLVGVTWGGAEYPWSSAATLCPLLLGLAGVGGAVAWEVKGAKTPFIRLALFNNRSAVATYICTVLMAFLIYGCMYYLAFWLIVAKQMSNILAGVGLLPFGLTVVPVSGITGIIISKTGRFQWAIWVGWVLATLGTGLLVWLDQHTSTPAWVLIFLVTGMGQGFLMISLSAATQAIAETKDVAYAGSMYSFMRSLGLCLGVSISGTVFQNFLARRLVHLGLPAAIARNAEAYVPVLRAMAESPEKQAILGAYIWAFRMLFATLTGVSGVGLVVGLFIKRYSLDKKLDSAHVLRKVKPGKE